MGMDRQALDGWAGRRPGPWQRGRTGSQGATWQGWVLAAPEPSIGAQLGPRKPGWLATLPTVLGDEGNRPSQVPAII